MIDFGDEDAIEGVRLQPRIIRGDGASLDCGRARDRRQRRRVDISRHHMSRGPDGISQPRR
jgi:hypothetical protein